MLDAEASPAVKLRASRQAAFALRRARGRLSGLRFVLPLALFIVVLVAWQVASNLGAINPLFFSSPVDVVRAGVAQIPTAMFWLDVRTTAYEFAAGYFIALALAVPFGLVTGWYRRLSYIFDPWLNAFNSLPRLALLPLIVLWVGLGTESKVVVAALGAFFPMAFNTFHGVRVIEPKLLRVAEVYRTSQARIFTTIVVPSTVPFIIAGARIGVGRAMAGVVVGEYFTAQSGIAYRMFQAGQTLQTGLVVFYAIVLSIGTLLLFRLVTIAEKRFTHWRSGSEPDL